MTCSHKTKRAYSTAGNNLPGDNPIYSATELQTSYSAAEPKDRAPLTPEKKATDNVYSTGPGASGEDMQENTEENVVKANLNVDDDNEEDKVVTAL